jgi:hypothetical protein
VGSGGEKLDGFGDLPRIHISLELFQGYLILLKILISFERVQISAQGTSRCINSPMSSCCRHHPNTLNFLIIVIFSPSQQDNCSNHVTPVPITSATTNTSANICKAGFTLEGLPE